jgi:hypothetical protein
VPNPTQASAGTRLPKATVRLTGVGDHRHVVAVQNPSPSVSSRRTRPAIASIADAIEVGVGQVGLAAIGQL